MPYATRPMGDYKTYGYAGDPGFLSKIWKGIKAVGKVALTAAFPVPAAIYSAVRHKPDPPMQFPTQVAPSFPGVGARGPASPGWWGQTAGPQPYAAAPGVPRIAGPTGQMQCPSGYHYAKDGSGRLVRNRRMNVANPRALRRSMRRVQGFEKLAKRTIQFTRRTRMKKRASS